MTVSVLMIVGGGIALFAGGELLVRGAVALARRAGVGHLLIGMTVVALCTSAPEFVVSVDAALRGSSAIAVGNVLGSNVSNLLLVLAVAALVSPLSVEWADIRPDVFTLCTATVGVALAISSGSFGRAAGAACLAALITYLFLSYRAEKRGPRPSEDWHAELAEEYQRSRPRLYNATLMVVGGLAALAAGASLLVDGAIDVARASGVPEYVVGLTVVALGSSLPELATSAVAARRGEYDVAVGNVVGSSTLNVLLIMGVAALVEPLSTSAEIAIAARVTVLVTLAVCALLVRAKTIGRGVGVALLCSYGVYVAWVALLPTA